MQLKKGDTGLGKGQASYRSSKTSTRVYTGARRQAVHLLRKGGLGVFVIMEVVV